MQKIIPNLWFDKEALEAAGFYTSLFPNSSITYATTLRDTPSGDCDVVSFELAGQKFMAISAGPYFKFNPSISFHIRCNTKEEIDVLWGKLSKGGKVLMELGTYPFSAKYGWVEDKYGLSWQLIFSEDEVKQKIMPALLFVGDVCGKTEEAINFYAKIFRNSKAEVLARYGRGEDPDKEGTVKYARFVLEGQEFGAMDSAWEHKFIFNEAVSFTVRCDTQEEIDYYWEKLSAVPEAEQCGWIKDKYGVSWQIAPSLIDEMFSLGTEEQINRITQAFLKMRKFDIGKLREIYENDRKDLP